MELVITAPSSWKRSVAGTSAMFEVAAGLVVEITRIYELPEDVADWSHHAAERDAPPGIARVEITHRADDKTELGWPIAIYDSRALDAAGIAVEHRIHAMYVLIEHAAAIAIRARSGELLAEHRDALLGVLRTARPDWGVPVDASLEDLLAT